MYELWISDKKDFLATFYEELDRVEAKEYEVLLAWEDASSYEGVLYAVLSKGGRLFEYEDSHCSCNGYEFNPQPVTEEYLRQRPDPTLCPKDFRARLLASLEMWDKTKPK